MIKGKKKIPIGTCTHQRENMSGKACKQLNKQGNRHEDGYK